MLLIHNYNHILKILFKMRLMKIYKKLIIYIHHLVMILELIKNIQDWILNHNIWIFNGLELIVIFLKIIIQIKNIV